MEDKIIIALCTIEGLTEIQASIKWKIIENNSI